MKIIDCFQRKNEDDKKKKACKISAHHRKIIKIPRKYWIFGGLFGGGKGIRTLVRLLSNGFQDRLVMTTSISLRKGIQFQSLEKILEKTLERMMRRRRKILKVKEIQGFFEVCFRYDKKFSRPPRYDRFDTSPYMNLSFDRNHLIFNCFRNSFRNALLCCLRSA